MLPVYDVNAALKYFINVKRSNFTRNFSNNFSAAALVKSYIQSILSKKNYAFSFNQLKFLVSYEKLDFILYNYT